jgi:hypothetical protein
LPAQQLDKLGDGKAGVGDDAAKGALLDLLVIRTDDASVASAPPQDHVAAALAAKFEPRAFQGGAQVDPTGRSEA